MAFNDRYERRHQWRNHNKNSGSIVGLAFLVAGGLLIARAAGAPIPSFLISWQMLLIGIGLFSGISSRFRNPGFFFPIVIGTAFLIRDYFPGVFPEDFLIPGALVAIGIYLIFKPRRIGNRWVNNDPPNSGAYTEATPGEPINPDTGGTQFFNSGPADTTSGERLQESAVFGNIRKNLITKNFSGGEVSTVFGSAEINLLQADIQREARLELNVVFGSIRLIVPTHWQIKMETSAVLGGIEDKRPKHAIYSDKILLLEGNAVFGGIQIESH
ncbi:LiaF transmembrane domain-containing protein [Flavihumibacter fluvii]|uniref:LiaF transmembrane domain-containing protein n=1 Tax=Flavihumibacter fluvii TaxID=2838157 RepID=UPI001BDDE48E|nr:LiaF domain-containing protein [Flavihumibacter fluvii]ULQ51017.1 cell wall-active antibiotics response protein [Flavihumibacter fluvii]